MQDVNITLLDTGLSVELTCIFASNSDSQGCQAVFECEIVKSNLGLQYVLSLFRISTSSKSVVGSLPCDLMCPSYIISVFDIYDDGDIAKVPAVIQENITCTDKSNSNLPEPTQSCKCFEYQ